MKYKGLPLIEWQRLEQGCLTFPKKTKAISDHYRRKAILADHKGPTRTRDILVMARRVVPNMNRLSSLWEWRK